MKRIIDTLIFSVLFLGVVTGLAALIQLAIYGHIRLW